MFEDRYIGEIVMAPYQRIPNNALPCDGRLLQINQFSSLFSVIGTIFGGDGKANFALPDFRGVFPMGSSSSSGVGKRVGGTGDGSVMLQAGNIPAVSGTAALNQTWSLDVGTVVKARQVEGALSPSDGYMLGEGGTGINSAPIYVSPATPGTDVDLGGITTSGTVTAKANIAVVAGSSAPSTVSLPCLAVNFYMIVIGIYPSFD